LNKKLSFSVSEVSLAEFIRAFSHDAGINVVLPTGLETPVRNNFKEVRAADMLAFLCREYDLEVEVHGSILCLTKRVAPPPLPKEVRVEYDSVRGKVLLDLQGEPLREVVKQVSHRTGVNVIAAPRVQERGVTCFVEALPVTEALGLMCRAAGLRLERVGKAAYLVDEAEREEETEEYGWGRRKWTNVRVDSAGQVSVEVKGMGVEPLFVQVMRQAGRKFRLLDPLEERVDMVLREGTLDDFLYQLFHGGRYAYREQEGVWYVGKRERAELKTFRMIPLRARSVMLSSVISSPSSRIRPLVGLIIPAMTLAKVDLPPPLGPVMATKRSSIFKLMSLSISLLCSGVSTRKLIF